MPGKDRMVVWQVSSIWRDLGLMASATHSDVENCAQGEIDQLTMEVSGSQHSILSQWSSDAGRLKLRLSTKIMVGDWIVAVVCNRRIAKLWTAWCYGKWNNGQHGASSEFGVEMTIDTRWGRRLHASFTERLSISQKFLKKAMTMLNSLSMNLKFWKDLF